LLGISHGAGRICLWICIYKGAAMLARILVWRTAVVTLRPFPFSGVGLM
jgi:hypothetical protein